MPARLARTRAEDKWGEAPCVGQYEAGGVKAVRRLPRSASFADAEAGEGDAAWAVLRRQSPGGGAIPGKVPRRAHERRAHEKRDDLWGSPPRVPRKEVPHGTPHDKEPLKERKR